MTDITGITASEQTHAFPFRRLWLTAAGQGVAPQRYLYQLHLHRADMLEKTGEWEQAEKVYQRSVDWCRQAGYRSELAEAIIWLCRLRRNRGKSEGQLSMVAESLEISRTLGDVNGEIRGHDNLGLIHFFEGRLDEAAAEYHTAIELAERGGLEQLLISALGNLARAQMLQGDYEQSIAANLRVIELCRKHGDDSRRCMNSRMAAYLARLPLLPACCALRRPEPGVYGRVHFGIEKRTAIYSAFDDRSVVAFVIKKAGPRRKVSSWRDRSRRLPVQFRHRRAEAPFLSG